MNEDIAAFLLLILIFLGECLLIWLIAALHDMDYPAPLWRWCNRTFLAFAEALMRLYAKTPTGKRALAAEQAAARHRDLSFTQRDSK